MTTRATIIILLSVVLLATTAALIFNLTPALPNFQKDGKLLSTWSCDAGKTTIRKYNSKSLDKMWAADEYSTTSGDVIVEFWSSYENDGYYAKPSGTNKMKKISNEEFLKLLKEKMPNASNYLYSRPDDCKIVEEGQ